MHTPTNLLISLTLFTACRGSDDTTVLEQRIDTLENLLEEQSTILATQQETITSLSEEVQLATDQIANMEEQSNLSSIQEQVDANTNQLLDLDPNALATQAWVITQNYVNNDELTNTETLIAANATSISANTAALSSTNVLATSNLEETLQNAINISSRVHIQSRLHTRGGRLVRRHDNRRICKLPGQFCAAKWCHVRSTRKRLLLLGEFLP